MLATDHTLPVAPKPCAGGRFRVRPDHRRKPDAATVWQVVFDLNRSSAPGITPRGPSPLGNKAEGANGRTDQEWAQTPAPTRGGGAPKPSKQASRKSKHGRTVSFGAVTEERRQGGEGPQEAAGDVEKGWPTRPRAEAGEPLQSPRQVGAAVEAHAPFVEAAQMSS